MTDRFSIVLMALDYITGIMCAIVEKKLSSAIRFKGLFKKIDSLWRRGNHR